MAVGCRLPVFCHNLDAWCHSVRGVVDQGFLPSVPFRVKLLPQAVVRATIDAESCPSPAKHPRMRLEFDDIIRRDRGETLRPKRRVTLRPKRIVSMESAISKLASFGHPWRNRMLAIVPNAQERRSGHPDVEQVRECRECQDALARCCAVPRCWGYGVWVGVTWWFDDDGAEKVGAS